MKDRYLKILKEKEEEAKVNHKTAVKAYLQTKAIQAAATRERIAFEEGMKE